MTPASALDWRYPADAILFDALRSDPELAAARARADTGMLASRDRTRAHLLAEGVQVRTSLLPSLSSAIGEINERFPDVGRIECFVVDSPSINAFVARGRDRMLCGISSAAVNGLDTAELQCVIGHELGHVLLGHNDVAVSYLAARGELAPHDLRRFHAWQRASEISADRASLIACGALDVAASTLFKVVSGLVRRDLAPNAQELAAQWAPLLAELGDIGERDLWTISHPFPPLRMQAMIEFWTAWQSPRRGTALAEANRRIDRMLAAIDPQAAPSAHDDPLLDRFLFWAGLHLATGEAGIDAGARKRLAAIAPEGVDVKHAMARARSEPGSALAELEAAREARRRKLAAAETHRLLIALIDLATADGTLDAGEMERLCEVAARLGIGRRACELLVERHSKEARDVG